MMKEVVLRGEKDRERKPSWGREKRRDVLEGRTTLRTKLIPSEGNRDVCGKREE